MVFRLGHLAADLVGYPRTCRFGTNAIEGLEDLVDNGVMADKRKGLHQERRNMPMDCRVTRTDGDFAHSIWELHMTKKPFGIPQYEGRVRALTQTPASPDIKMA
jgi:hypothetical protein